MTAPADLDAVRAALAMVAQATPGPWATDPDGDLVGPNASVRHPNGTTGNLVGCLFAEHDTAAIVALRNAAPSIAAAVEELERLRAENEALRKLFDENPSLRVKELAAARAEIAALNRQVCRLVSGQEIDGDRLCQHHGADVAALAQIARYQVAAVAVATEIGGSLGPVDDDPEERAAAFVRFAESLAGRARDRVEALEADLGRALHRERRAGDESGERLREMAELLIKDANNE